MNKVELFKPVIRLYKPDETRKLCSFKVPQNKAGELFVDIKPESPLNNFRFIIELKNRLGKLLGYEIYSHFEGSDKMTGLYINVLDEYRQRHYFFGEILRLASIIQMLENKIKTFSIKSKETAIYFHSKYKFEPSITSFDERDRLLKNVADDTDPNFKDLALQAKELIERIKTPLQDDEKRRMCVNASAVLKEYISRALADSSTKQHKLKWPVDMKLTDKIVRENKDYLDSLFIKHGIDYKI